MHSLYKSVDKIRIPV